MIRNWNEENLKGCVFHFKNSLRPFTDVILDDFNENEFYFLDINEMKLYSFNDLEREGLFFYTKEEDCDFLGVEVDGTVKEWF